MAAIVWTYTTPGHLAVRYGCLAHKAGMSMTAPSLGTLVLLTSAFVAGTTAQAQQPPPNSKPATVAATSKAPVTSHPARNAAGTKAPSAQPIKTTTVRTPPPTPGPMFILAAENVGFTLQDVRGTLKFCRTASDTGSRIPVTACYGQEEMKHKLENHEFDRDKLSDQISNGTATIRQ